MVFFQDKTTVMKSRRLIIKLGKQLAGWVPGEAEEPKREKRKAVTSIQTQRI